MAIDFEVTLPVEPVEEHSPRLFSPPALPLEGTAPQAEQPEISSDEGAFLRALQQEFGVALEKFTRQSFSPAPVIEEPTPLAPFLFPSFGSVAGLAALIVSFFAKDGFLDRYLSARHQRALKKKLAPIQAHLARRGAQKSLHE